MTELTVSNGFVAMAAAESAMDEALTVEELRAASDKYRLAVSVVLAELNTVLLFASTAVRNIRLEGLH